MQKMLAWIQRHRHRHLGIKVITAATVTAATVTAATVKATVTVADPIQIQIPIEYALKLRRLDIAAKTDALNQSPIRKIKPLLAIHFAMRCKCTA